MSEAGDSVERIASVLSAKSAWPADEAVAFLTDSLLPLRLSTLDRDGFPHITSLWFFLRNGRLLCCTQEQSLVCRHLRRDPRVGFEVAVNEPPYFGVSGRGEARIVGGDPTELLGDLMHHYLRERDAKLKAWLLSRIATEVTIEVSPSHLTSWDFRARMTSAS